jgi:ribosome-associated protein
VVVPGRAAQQAPARGHGRGAFGASAAFAGSGCGPVRPIACGHHVAMADVLPINRDVSIPLDEVSVQASRSSGPGGQHANKTESRIEVSFDVAASATLDDAQKLRVVARCGPVVRAVAQDARGQARNRALALERLAARLARALEVPRVRRATKPTKASRARRMDLKRRDAQRKRERRRPAAEE